MATGERRGEVLCRCKSIKTCECIGELCPARSECLEDAASSLPICSCVTGVLGDERCWRLCLGERELECLGDACNRSERMDTLASKGVALEWGVAVTTEVYGEGSAAIFPGDVLCRREHKASERDFGAPDP